MDTELCRHGHFVPAIRECFGKQRFVVSSAVHVGGVEEVDAEFDSCMLGFDVALFITRSAVELRHAHASEADAANPKRAIAESLVVFVMAVSRTKQTRSAAPSSCPILPSPDSPDNRAVAGDSVLHLLHADML